MRSRAAAPKARAAPRRPGLLGFLDKSIRVVVAANFIAVAARMSLVTFLGIYFVREARIDVGTVGLAFLVESLLRGVAAPMFGALSDRIGRRALLVGAALVTAIVLPSFLLVSGPASLFAWTLHGNELQVLQRTHPSGSPGLRRPSGSGAGWSPWRCSSSTSVAMSPPPLSHWMIAWTKFCWAVSWIALVIATFLSLEFRRRAAGDALIVLARTPPDIGVVPLGSTPR